MQEKEHIGEQPARIPSGDDVKVPTQYWEELKQRDLHRLRVYSLARPYPPRGLLLPFLKECILVDWENRSLHRQSHGNWEHIENSLLELLCLVYLLNAGPGSIRGEVVSVKELKSAHFFRGPHALSIQPLLDLYGNHLDAFKAAAESIRGEALDLADVSYRFLAFPKVPLYYLIWKGDEEFRARLSILFDRSIEDHLAADAIWGLVNLVSRALLSYSPSSGLREKD